MNFINIMNCRQAKPFIWGCQCQMSPFQVNDKFPLAKIKKKSSIKTDLSLNNLLKNKTSLRKNKQSPFLISNESGRLMYKNQGKISSRPSQTLRIIQKDHEGIERSPIMYRQTVQKEMMNYNSINLNTQNNREQTHHLQSNPQGKENVFQPLTPILKNKNMIGQEYKEKLKHQPLQSFLTNDSSNRESKIGTKVQDRTAHRFQQSSIDPRRPVSMTKVQIVPRGKTLLDFTSTVELESVHGEDEESSEEFSEVIMGFRKIGNPTHQLQLKTLDQDQ